MLPPRLLAGFAFAAIALVWGSTLFAIKIGYGGVPPLVGASLRFVLAALVLFAVLAVRRLPLPRGRGEWGLVVFLGLVMFGLDYGLLYWGGQFVPSGLASVLFGTSTFWALLAAAASGAERVTARKLVGLALGLAGVAVLLLGGVDGASPAGVVAVLASAAAAAVATVVMRRHGGGMSAVTMNAPAMLVGSVALLGAARATGEPIALPVGGAAWASVLYLAVGGSAVAFLLYTWLLRTWDASRVTFVFLVTPVVTILLGTAFLGEPLTARVLVGTGVVLAGVYATASGAGAARPTSAPPPLAAAAACACVAVRPSER